MAVAEATIISKLLDWLLILLSGGILYLFRKAHKHDEIIAAHNTEIRLCHQRDKQRDEQRIEERKLRDKQREEIIRKIDSHHKLAMDKLDRLIENPK